MTDTAPPDDFESEPLKGIHSIFNACMYQDTCKATEARLKTAVALLEEWERGEYDGRDFLRRVRLALHAGKPRVSLASLRGIAKKT